MFVILNIYGLNNVNICVCEILNFLKTIWKTMKVQSSKCKHVFSPRFVAEVVLLIHGYYIQECSFDALLHCPLTVHSTPVAVKENVTQQKRTHFHFDLWFWLTLQNWVLDFGRPIIMVMRFYVTICIIHVVW